MLDPDFTSALETAIAKAKRRALAKVGGATVVLGAFWGSSLLAHRGAFGIIPGGILLVIGWVAALTERTPAVRDLARLRGAQVEQWWTSPSHGLVVVTRRGLVLGKIGELSLLPDEKKRLFSASYDDASHALVLTANVTKYGRDGEYVESKQYRVRLPKDLTPERAYEAARAVDRRTTP